MTALVAWVALCFAAAAFGRLFRPGAWYAELEKPAWTPPDAVFPVVWPILYLTMGIAAWLVWRERAVADVRLALALFLAQLALNAAWSWIFFGLHRIGTALVEITILWIAIAATALAFSRVHRGAALLLVPYLAWVAYAAALNLAVWRLNP